MKNLYRIFSLISMIFIVIIFLSACESEEKAAEDGQKKIPPKSIDETDTSRSQPTPAIDSVKQDENLPNKQLSSKKIEMLLREILLEIAVARTGPGASLPFEISIYEGNDIVAVYMPGRGIVKKDAVLFGKPAFNILHDHFKDRWKEAVAAILGHEFGHHLDGVKHPTDFLQGERNYASSPMSEEIADVNGVFFCYLAGYDPRSAYEDVLRVMYKAYSAPVEGNDKYPSLEHRVKATQKAMDKVSMLIQLFESGNLLSASGEYVWASYCFNEITQQHYMGREIYFNKGMNSLLAALNGKYKLDQFAWPVEQDWQTRLQRQQESIKALSPEKEKEERSTWLRIAEEAFQEARKIDPGYHKAALYELVVLALREDTKALQDFYNSYQFEKKQVAEEMLDIAKLAIALHYLNKFKNKKEREEYQNAKKQLDNLRRSKSPYVKLLANANSAISDEKFSPNPEIPLDIPHSLYKLISNPSPGINSKLSNKWETTSALLNGVELWEAGNKSSLVRIKSNSTSISICRQQMNKGTSPNISNIKKQLSPSSIIPVSEGGNLIVLNAGKIGKVLLKSDDKGVVKEIAKIDCY